MYNTEEGSPFYRIQLSELPVPGDFGLLPTAVVIDHRFYSFARSVSELYIDLCKFMSEHYAPAGFRMQDVVDELFQELPTPSSPELHMWLSQFANWRCPEFTVKVIDDPQDIECIEACLEWGARFEGIWQGVAAGLIPTGTPVIQSPIPGIIDELKRSSRNFLQYFTNDDRSRMDAAIASAKEHYQHLHELKASRRG